MNSANKDASGRAPCPICRKPVKLRKAAGERWANTIPHHHMGRLSGAAFVEAVDAEVAANRRIELAARDLLEALTVAVEIAEGKRTGTWDDLLPFRAAILKATKER